MTMRLIGLPLLVLGTFVSTLCPGQSADSRTDDRVEQVIRKAETYFIVGEDEEGFRTLDAAIQKHRGQPAEAEFLYAKAMELCKYHRQDSEKAEGRKLLKEYAERFPEGRHFAAAVADIQQDLSAAELERYLRVIVGRPQEAAIAAWAMERLADLVAKGKPQEALSLRKRLIEEHPASGEAYRALRRLAGDDFDAGRLKDAADKLRKCLFDFTHLPCELFEKDEELLAAVVQKEPELRLPEGNPLPEYTPRWKEGECWEMKESGASPENKHEWERMLLKWEPSSEIPLLHGLPTAAPNSISTLIADAWSYVPEAAASRTIFAHVGSAEERSGKLCRTIRRAGMPYAYSPELVIYLGRDDSNFVDAAEGKRPFDPFNWRRLGTVPFHLPEFPLKPGKTFFSAGQHRIVQECSIKDGKAEIRLSHCGGTVVMLFSKNPVWWDEVRYLTPYYLSSRGPAVPIPMVCRLTRSSRTDPSLDLAAELAAHSLMGKIEKAMHENKTDEMKSAGEELLKKFPNHRFCATYLGLLSRQETNAELRKAALDRLLREYPASPEARRERERFVQGLKGQEKVTALRHLMKSESGPGAAMELHGQLLYALSEVGDDDGAVNEYEKMEAEASKREVGDRRISRALADARWPAAAAYYRLGKFGKAVELFQILRKPEHILNVCALVRLGRFKAAIQACKQNDSRTAEIVRGFAWYGLGNKQQAAAGFERATFDRLDPQAMTYLALLYGELGRKQEARKTFAELLRKFPDEKVYTDLILRLYTADEPTTTVREFCEKRLGTQPVPPAERISWELQHKSSRESLYVDEIYTLDINGDGYVELLANSASGFRVLDHNLGVLWELRGPPRIGYVDFRPRVQQDLIFAYERRYDSAKSMWIDAAGKIVDQVEYAPKFARGGRLSGKVDAIEFTYGRSAENQIVASRRKVFLRDKEGRDIWTYALGGVPEKKGSDRRGWAATPAVQDVRAADLDGDGKDEFLVVVEKRDIGIGMTYYLTASGGGLVLLGSDGRPKWEHDMGIVKRVSFRDCTGDGKKEVVAEADGVRVISPDGKLLCQANPKGFDLGDYDGGGDLELFLCSSEGVTVQKLDGTRLLRAEFPDGRDVAWGDITADGVPEIVAVGDRLLVMDRSGKLIFSRDSGKRWMSGVLIIDADNDGRNEVVAFGRDIDIYELAVGSTAGASSN